MKGMWSLQDVKARFSALVKKVVAEGPQVVSVHGVPKVVVISQEEYEALSKPSESLLEFFQKSPLCDLELDFARDKSLPREVAL